MAQYPNTKKTTAIKVVVDIRPGKGTDYQRALIRKLFSSLLAECQRELKSESEGKGG